MLIARPATVDDVAYILKSFVLGFRGSPYAEGLTHSQIRGLMVALLESASWNATCLVESEVPDEIISFVVWKSPTEIAWIHTKGRFRPVKGMAKRLLTMIGAKAFEAPFGVARIKTPFVPSPQFSRRARARGWILLHRPWMGAR